MARLVHTVTMSYGNGIPLGGETNPKQPKLLFLDTGLYLRESGLDLGEWIQDSPSVFVNRGKLAELFVGLELLKAGSPFQPNSLFYWRRESRNANAEIDYLVQYRNQVLPIEAKSGTRGAMQSLHLFLQEKQLPFGIRTSQENFAAYQKIRVIPLYAIANYGQFLAS